MVFSRGMCRILVISLFVVVSYGFGRGVAISAEDQKNATTLLHLNLASNEANVYKSKAGNGLVPEFKFYESYSYEEYLNELEKLKKSCGNIMTITPAHDIYTGELYTADYYQCGANKCQMPIVHLSGDLNSTTLPEIYISGEVHGDERLGPVASLEFLKMACYMYKTSPVIQYLLKTRSIWITPITNALGYYNNTRGENGVDPNRDFPYRRQTCMNTITSRVVNELFIDHLFQLVISNHGGMRALGWQRGDPFDRTSGNAPESHDAIAHDDIGYELTEAAGLVNTTNPFDTNTSNFGVPVNGGYYFYKSGLLAATVGNQLATIEDWSYAASWHNHSQQCTKSDSLGLKAYPLDKTNYKKSGSEINGMRAAQFIFELDKTNDPNVALYGHSMQLTNPEMFNGFIPRTLRMFLKATEYVQPDILLLNSPSVTPTVAENQTKFEIKFNVMAVGCNKTSSLDLLVYEGGCNDAIESPKIVVPLINSSKPCSGLELWKGWDSYELVKDYSSKVDNKFIIEVASIVNLSSTSAEPTSSVSVPFCVKLQGTFDQHWDTANPLNAQTHLVKSRTLESYTATARNSSIATTKNKIFPIQNHWGSDYSKGIEIRTETTTITETDLPASELTTVSTKNTSSTILINVDSKNSTKVVEYKLLMSLLKETTPKKVPPFWDYVEVSEKYKMELKVCLKKNFAENLTGNLSIYLYDLLPGYLGLSKEPITLKEVNLSTLTTNETCTEVNDVYNHKELESKVESEVTYGALTVGIATVDDTMMLNMTSVTLPMKRLSGYKSASSMLCTFYDDKNFANMNIKKEDLDKPSEHIRAVEELLEQSSIGYVEFHNMKDFAGAFCPSTNIDPKESIVMKGSCNEINSTLSLKNSEKGNGYVFSGNLSTPACAGEISNQDSENDITLSIGDNVLAKCVLQADVAHTEHTHTHISKICAASSAIRSSLFGFVLVAIIAFLAVF